MIRQHHSQCEPVKTTSTDENLTEQSHAKNLEIKNMVRGGGFHFSEKKPIYGDFTELPNLDMVMKSRQRINQLHAGLPNKVKKSLRTPDEMIEYFKSNPDEESLIDIGLLPKPPVVPEPDPAPAPTEPPAE